MPYEDLINSLTDDQRERAKGIKSPEELLEFAKDEGMALSDEQLEDVAGGLISCVLLCKMYDPCRANMQKTHEASRQDYR